MTVPGTPLKPSTITGWSTSTVTAPLGTIVTSKIQVSSPPGGRYVELQYRKPGGKWTTEVGNSTDATGHITFTYKIGVGYTKWRVYAAWTTGFDEITSAERTLAPKTVITGFNTSTVSAPTGTKINDAIVVTPGANREVDLWLKPSGAASWTFAGKFVTAANGAVTLPEVAKKGTYLWNVTVPFNVYQGSATWSANRTIIGT
jgi:hypothetical protein